MMITKQRLMKDPTHKELYDAICQSLTDFGFFNCEWILRKTGIIPVSEIHWKELAKFAGEDNNMKLIPIAEIGFEKTKHKQLKIDSGTNDAGQYLVGGGRRKAVGWTSAGNADAAPLIRASVVRLRNVSRGVSDSADDTEHRLNQSIKAAGIAS
jgi:hypothetical protein